MVQAIGNKTTESGHRPSRPDRLQTATRSDGVGMVLGVLDHGMCELLDLRVKPVSGRCGVVGLVSWSLGRCFEDLVDSDLKDVDEFGVSVAVLVRDLKNMERLVGEFLSVGGFESRSVLGLHRKD
ncbi:MAG: hypothetical protein GY720_22885 [bacterium]|nr:hypothetical protein [bacterium]